MRWSIARQLADALDASRAKVEVVRAGWQPRVSG
jgi:hypothetical protein